MTATTTAARPAGAWSSWLWAVVGAAIAVLAMGGANGFAPPATLLLAFGMLGGLSLSGAV